MPAGHDFDGYTSNREREMRPERRYAIAHALVWMLKHVDLVTSVIGMGDDKKFYGLRVDTLADKAELVQRRIERAIHDVTRVGWLNSVKRAELLDDGSYRGHVSIRQLNMVKLAGLVGMGSQWEQASKQASRERSSPRPKSGADIVLAHQKAQNNNGTLVKPLERPAAPRPPGGAGPPGPKSLGSILNKLTRK